MGNRLKVMNVFVGFFFCALACTRIFDIFFILGAEPTIIYYTQTTLATKGCLSQFLFPDTSLSPHLSRLYFHFRDWRPDFSYYFCSPVCHAPSFPVYIYICFPGRACFSFYQQKQMLRASPRGESHKECLASFSLRDWELFARVLLVSKAADAVYCKNA